MFNDCRKACVYSQEGEYIAEARVVDANTDGMGLIFAESDMERLKTETVIVFYDGERGLVTCKCSLAARVRLEEAEIIGNQRAFFKVPCRIDVTLGVEQRRRDLKVRAHFPMEIQTVGEGGKAITVKGKAHDVSAGGIGFESPGKLDKDQIFTFQFGEEGNRVVLKARILWRKEITPAVPVKKEAPAPAAGWMANRRTEKKQEQEPEVLYQYGCSFVDLKEFQESAVRRFTFREQLRRKKMV